RFYFKSFEERVNAVRRPQMKMPSNKRVVNELSKSAIKKIRRSGEWLTYLSKKRAVKSSGGKVFRNFQVAFVTLTLPAIQEHSHADIISRSLNYFLVRMRKTYGLQNYIWKAEI